MTEVTEEQAAAKAATMDTYEGADFVLQNTLAAATIPEEAMDQWSQHHAGGLVVLIGEAGGKHYVKLHDSWSDEDTVVVHIYPMDDSDEGVVFHFKRGDHAIAFFEWAMEAVDVEVFG